MFLTAQGGFLGPIAWVFGKLLDLTYNLLANDQGIANLSICIIVYAVIVKLILFPLTFNQQKTSKINSFIQPEMRKIQKKYRNKKDQASIMKQNEEMQALYDKYGTSMTAGCLPMLIQLPVIYGLLKVVYNIPAYVGKIKELYTPIADAVLSKKGGDAQQYIMTFVENNEISSSMATTAVQNFEELSEVGVNNIIDVISNFNVSELNTLISEIGMTDALSANVDKIDEIYSFVLGINFLEAPGFHLSWALLIPIVSVVFNFLSMKVSQSSQDSGDATTNTMMKSMMITMPVMSFFIGITFPAGIGIYWAVGALAGVVTQIGCNFYFDHIDMDKFLEKQVAKSAAKRAKKGDKKSFMQRMMESSQEAQEEYEKQLAMKKNSASSLKNYVASDAANNAAATTSNKQYKAGSIGSKANIMMNYNNKKEEK